ncbi:ArsR/SmtB family transcription factor [Massilia sp. BKSP1R2A-1]|jgi:ArsR family transcriptional regulator|uniref:ArsR/SmtB family transcription factor n=1 Tax=Massilia sp. BKSP1R2A-1 TaxID=3422595 RepID=UPI003D3311C0
MTSSCCGPSATPPADIDIDDLAALCKAIGHPARLQLLRHLIRHGDCYFGSLADVLPLAPSTISKHVSILKDAGLIEGSSDVQRVCYCVRPARLAQLKAMVGAL